ncbi:menaquinone biosynthesis polyprenyltransferase, putative [Syntrophotalea carbinolica DSM 2380]|uniref:4-hydroxybenzoate polyprenyltransferase n=1 Tax=Syntrophotalea carbinolica (strain DSM 2380 / NBRC 103641 / GraBd1) TaxID=338963 RepID=Q3A7R8_SYNC1|nr:4-hydroxybenzoate octaprenyltransferase [Syntrophotalea carbinolica]ABA87576.1 menaquinone biosynthesis polyprenyltransferase, putative [Syntrophotalea carbinolica DSM 2380]
MQLIKHQFNFIRSLLEMIAFSHSVFAFPFALLGALLAVQASGAWPTAAQLGWICLAMVGARSGAMGLNRIIDAGLDAENPRTRGRHIPSGKVSRRAAWLLVCVSFAALLLAAGMLNSLCLMLAPLAVALFVLYPFCKRFTALSHLVLGACLGAAPVGAWIALRGDVRWPVVLLGVAVLLWVAGFDILYALQDESHDRRAGLHSLPVRLGARRALLLARVLHTLMVLLLAGVAFGGGLGGLFLCGVLVTAGLLAWEHRLVRHDDLSRLNQAFFTMNGLISVLLFGFALGDVLVRF